MNKYIQTPLPESVNSIVILKKAYCNQYLQMSTIAPPRPRTKPSTIPSIRPEVDNPRPSRIPQRRVINPVIPEEWITPEEPKP